MFPKLSLRYVQRLATSLGVAAALLLTANLSACGDDWPMWRADAARSGDWEGTLPQVLQPLWTADLPPLQPAFQHPRLDFDLGYEPVVTAGRLIFGSSHNDAVIALDVVTGAEVWRFHTAGPVRFAPAVWRDRVYVGSDDGFLYCLDAVTGQLHWKHQAVPSARKVLGNRRLISLWPVRGGPVVADNTVYFAAGVWSFEGVFVYALDADSGDIRWINDRCGFLYGVHPHDARAFGGLTPQGYLLVQEDDLVVPCGTAVPAIFDRHSGELKSFELPRAGRAPGGWFTAAAKARRRGQEPQVDLDSPEADQRQRNLLLFDAESNRDRHEDGWREGPGTRERVRNQVVLNGIPYPFDQPFAELEGTIHSIVAAAERLFVVTREGQIHCFGDPASLPTVQSTTAVQTPVAAGADLDPTFPDPVNDLATLLPMGETSRGYAAVLGPVSATWLIRFSENSHWHLVVIDDDADRCQRLRSELDVAGLQGWRIAVVHADLPIAGMPPYFASAVIVPQQPEVASTAKTAWSEAVYAMLRPYGGIAVIRQSDQQFTEFRQTVENWAQIEDLATAQVRRNGDWTVMQRNGALPGAENYQGGWSSPDQRVKAPLGVLWFDDAVANFKRAPQPIFVDGVMISHDKDWQHYPKQKPPYPLLPARFSDVYTGRVFSEEEVSAWSAELPTRDLTEKQPSQYRPPTQTDPWKPQPPVIGQRFNPLTGETEPRAFPKSYGCDGGIDYEFLYTMRSGTPAFYDKQLESGTIHISGPRSGCTNSIIPANGLLNVPYFFQGCTCSYPLPVGLAMIPLPPQHEQWAVWGQGTAKDIQRVGINFGAPGARMTEAGTLWLEAPQSGGPAPEVDVQIEPAGARSFYRHSLWMQPGSGWPWVSASGIEALTAITLSGLRPGEYIVRLYFAEPASPDGQPLDPQRTFTVAIQGNTVERDFSILQTAGQPLQSVVRQYEDIASQGQLEIKFLPQHGQPLVCGMEVVATGLVLDPFDVPVQK